MEKARTPQINYLSRCDCKCEKIILVQQPTKSGLIQEVK